MDRPAVASANRVEILKWPPTSGIRCPPFVVISAALHITTNGGQRMPERQQELYHVSHTTFQGCPAWFARCFFRVTRCIDITLFLGNGKCDGGGGKRTFQPSRRHATCRGFVNSVTSKASLRPYTQIKSPKTKEFQDLTRNCSQLTSRMTTRQGPRRRA